MYLRAALLLPVLRKSIHCRISVRKSEQLCTVSVNLTWFQDCDHSLYMLSGKLENFWDLLGPTGLLVCLASESFAVSSSRGMSNFLFLVTTGVTVLRLLAAPAVPTLSNGREKVEALKSCVRCKIFCGSFVLMISSASFAMFSRKSSTCLVICASKNASLRLPSSIVFCFRKGILVSWNFWRDSLRHWGWRAGPTQAHKEPPLWRIGFCQSSSKSNLFNNSSNGTCRWEHNNHLAAP